MKTVYLKIVIVAAVLSLACTTKVSEWVLLNSTPEKYMLVYFHKGAITEPAKQQNTELENRFTSANLILKTVERDDIESPKYALYFNNTLMAEYQNYNELTGITHSPLRDKIASELIEGKLSVMLYLKCGNKEKDDYGLQVVNKTIAASPFGKVITVVELDRSSVVENHFIAMLLNVEDDLKDIKEPMLFGIFGCFRTLEPLLAKGISEDNINLMIDFLTADCSCLIKDDLPGRNMLYNGNWENPKTALVNQIMDDSPHLEHQ